MSDITVHYTGGMRATASNPQTGATLTTSAAPSDLSPTDLVAVALGSCILMTMDMVAKRHNLDLTGATATVHKEMTTVPHRRIGQLSVHIHVPTPVPLEQRERLEHAAHACPVHRSLHPDIQSSITFQWNSP
jgi:putative redox protein